MAFFNVKKKEKKKKKECFNMVCGCCKEQIEVECSKTKAVFSGYKGQLNFFVDCPKCNNTIYIDEAGVPAQYVKRLYKAAYD